MTVAVSGHLTWVLDHPDEEETRCRMAILMACLALRSCLPRIQPEGYSASTQSNVPNETFD